MLFRFGILKCTDRVIYKQSTSVKEKGEMSYSETYSDSPVPVAKSTPISSKVDEPKKRKVYKKLPKVASMVDEAIFKRSKRGKGLSLYGVKKYLEETYKLNVKLKRSATKIREHIKLSLESKRFIQVTGRGANGSFRLSKNVRRSMYSLKQKSESQQQYATESKEVTRSQRKKAHD